MYKLAHNLLVWIILKYVKLLIKLNSEIGYRDGDIILIVHSGNLDSKDAINLRKSLWEDMEQTLDEWSEGVKYFSLDGIMLDYL